MVSLPSNRKHFCKSILGRKPDRRPLLPTSKKFRRKRTSDWSKFAHSERRNIPKILLPASHALVHPKKNQHTAKKEGLPGVKTSRSIKLQICKYSSWYLTSTNNVPLGYQWQITSSLTLPHQSSSSCNPAFTYSPLLNEQHSLLRRRLQWGLNSMVSGVSMNFWPIFLLWDRKKVTYWKAEHLCTKKSGLEFSGQKLDEPETKYSYKSTHQFIIIFAHHTISNNEKHT